MSWAILSDCSGVEETPDGFGKFETRRDALEVLVRRLTAERDVAASKLKRAKLALKHIDKPPPAPGPCNGKFASRAELKAAVIAWYTEKVSMRIIAKRAGVTYGVVYQITRNHRAKDMR